MRQHALTHKNSERSNSPNSSTNSDNDQNSQTETYRDNEHNEQSDDEGDHMDNLNDETFEHKMTEDSPPNLKTLDSIDEDKVQRQQPSAHRDEHEDISRSQSNSSKNTFTSSHEKNPVLNIFINTITSLISLSNPSYIASFAFKILNDSFAYLNKPQYFMYYI